MSDAVAYIGLLNLGDRTVNLDAPRSAGAPCGVEVSRELLHRD
jgi:hypothetical protein